MITEDVEYATDGVRFRGFLAAPGGSQRRAAILVAHEAPGLSEHTRDVAERLAREGYVAFAMDYVGAGRRFTEVPEVIAQVNAWVADPLFLRQTFEVAHRLLASRNDVDGDRIAGFGYCFGGQALIEYARTGAPLVAIIGFHPGMSINRPQESRAIRSRLLMFLGTEDPITTRVQRLAFEDEMTAAGVDWRMVLYSGVGHSFTNAASAAYGLPKVAYDATADRASWAAAKHFLAECGL